MPNKRKFGDWQTPISFAKQVCNYLKDQLKLKPTAVIEPTCGVGGMLQSSLIFNAQEYYGIEINPDYCQICEQQFKDQPLPVEIINADFFSLSSAQLVKNKEQILVIGNPPWVNNSTLGMLDSANLPTKSNFKKLRGIEAITGAGDFDICEAIILKLIEEYTNSNTIISMLCKTSVARKVFSELIRNNIHFSSCDILEFDAKKVFNVSTSACLFIIQLSPQATTVEYCTIADFSNPSLATARLYYKKGELRQRRLSAEDNSNLESKINSILEYDFDGNCCFEWRQGIKHDCAKVMELTLVGYKFYNGWQEEVDIEADLIFPLVKSSMFKHAEIRQYQKYVIVPQQKIKQDTAWIEETLPKTWAYLNSKTEFFNKRKSSIYRNSPPFSIFGVGDYSFADYKVGISGFYKQPFFSILSPDFEFYYKPAMTDDTCYFLSFKSYDLAYCAMLLLNSAPVQSFLSEIAFLDSKRPYTKRVLTRLDFGKIIKQVTISELKKIETKLKLDKYINAKLYKSFKQLVQEQSKG